MPVPGTDDIVSATTTYGKAYAILEAKYGTAGAWATWAGGVVEDALSKMVVLDDGFDVTALVDAVITTLDAIPAFAHTALPTYTAPEAPTYTAIPAYVAATAPTMETVPTYAAPTLGALTAIPTINSIVMPSSPSSTVNYVASDFTNAFHSFFTEFIQDAMESGSTGLGNAESALFTRARDRENTIKLAAYEEAAYQFSANGFPMPTGALVSAQTAADNESALRLVDINAQIMAESARLSNSYGQALLQASGQLDQMLYNIWNSSEERAFNKAKEDVNQAVAVFTAVVNAAVAQGQLDVSRVQAVTAANDGVIKVYTAQIDAQIEPMKAIVSLNTALVQQYAAEVDAAIAPITGISSANVAVAEGYKAAIAGAAGGISAVAQVVGAEADAYKASAGVGISKADVTSKFVLSEIDAAVRQYAAKLGAFQASAQVAGQMVASSLNAVSVSSSFAWQGSSSSTESTSESVQHIFENA